MKKPKPVGCAWCKRPVEQPAVGRPRRYCGVSCRQRAYEERRALRELGDQLAKRERRVRELKREQGRERRRQRDAFNAALEAVEIGGLDHAIERRRALFGR